PPVLSLGPGDHRHLHSFPTRRSSDLPDGDKLDGADAAGERVGVGVVDVNIEHVASLAAVAIKHHDAVTVCSPNHLDDDGIGIVLDRKSTRLNSSHVKISYAVFCLKKK